MKHMYPTDPRDFQNVIPLLKRHLLLQLKSEPTVGEQDQIFFQGDCIYSQSSTTLRVMSEDPRTLSIPEQSIKCSYLNAVPIFTLVYIPMVSGAIWSSTLWAVCQSAQNMPLVSLILPTSWEDPTSHPGSKEEWSMQVGLVYLCLLMTKMIGVNIEWIGEMFLHPNLPWCDSLGFACSLLTEHSHEIYHNATLCPSSTKRSCVTVTRLHQGCLLFVDRIPLHPRLLWCHSFGFTCPSSTERSCVTMTQLRQGCLLFVDQTPLHPRLPWCNSFRFACSLLTERPCTHIYLKWLLWVCLFFTPSSCAQICRSIWVAMAPQLSLTPTQIL